MNIPTTTTTNICRNHNGHRREYLGRIEVAQHLDRQYPDVIAKAFEGCEIVERVECPAAKLVVYYVENEEKFERLPDDVEHYTYDFLFRNIRDEKTGRLTPYYGFRRRI